MSEEGDSVVLFARKILANNTRIFKQAKTLAEKGYDVTIIGIRPDHLPAEEQGEEYDIVRVGKITPDFSRLRSVVKKFIPLYPVYVVLKRLLVRYWERDTNPLREFIESRLDRFRARFPVPKIFQTSDGNRLRRSQQRTERLANRLLNEALRQLLSHGRWFVMSYNYYTEGYRAMAERDLDPDVIHANDLDSLIVSIVAAHRHDAPLIYDAQELYTEIHTLPRWYRHLLMVQEFFLIRCADRVTVVNPFIAEVMERRYGLEIDEVVLNCPPLTATEEDAPSGPTVREKFDIDPDTPVVLYSGGLSTERGLENLVEAMNEVPEVALVILGEGALRPELASLVERFGLGDRVYFSDFVPHEEVPAFISSADIGVIPYQQVGMNHYLSSPSKLFHYIMAELVIVGSDFSFLEHVITDNDIGETFDPDDPKSMAAAITAITEDEARLERHRENVKRAKHRYTWENEAEKLLAQYEAIHERRTGDD